MNAVPGVGLQLYTVREECARDFESVLRTVGELGYDGVELFNLHGHEPERVRGWLDEYGLAAAGRHAGLSALEDGLPALAAELAVLGTGRLALSWIDPPESADDVRAAVERIAAIAPRVQDVGLEFGFHNHWGEFAVFAEGGAPPSDRGVSVLDLLFEVPAELLWLELDLGWAWEAGADPVELLRRAKGRSPLVHVKDLRSRGSRVHCPVGDGAVGYGSILPAAIEAGVEWLIVEQDEVDGPPFDAVERSLQFVRGALPVTA